jgi:hypothetical protein
MLHWLHSFLPHVPRYGFVLGFAVIYSPSLRQGWTTPERKHNINQWLQLTHGVAQKSEPGQWPKSLNAAQMPSPTPRLPAEH